MYDLQVWSQNDNLDLLAAENYDGKSLFLFFITHLYKPLSITRCFYKTWDILSSATTV